jgi:hypothetical protein
MMFPSSRSWLQALICSSMLVHTSAVANLEDYMRYTPPPVEMEANETVAVNETMATSTMAATTTQPTYEPTLSPTTFAPTGRPSSSEPSSAPTETASGVPTAQQTIAATTLAPTDSPTEGVTTTAPTEGVTTVAPTSDAPSKAPTAEATTVTPAPSTDAPRKEDDVELTPAESEAETATETTESPTEEAVAVEEPDIAASTPPATTETEAPGDLFSESTDSEDGVGEIFVEFSLYSPNVTNLEINFMKLKMGVCKSLDPLVCDQAHPIREEGPEYCAVRDEVLLRDGVADWGREPIVLTDYGVTMMALASTNVKDTEDVIHGQSIAWTTWRMSYNVIQLGSALLKHINDTEGTAELNPAEVNAVGLAAVQQMMEVNMERTLRNGALQQDLNDFMKDIMLVASVVGEEVPSYEPFVKRVVSPAAQGEELQGGEDGEGGGLMVVFFFAGLGVACFVIVTLLYFSFRSRRSVVRRKRTIVILDDSSKSCTDSQGSSANAQKQQQQAQPVVDTAVMEKDSARASARSSAHRASTQRASASRPQQEDVEAQPEEPEPEKTSSRHREEQQQQQEQQQAQQWDGASSVGNQTEEAGEEEETETQNEDADVESQWGRSMAQSSAYTGSISAITGVSGLEHSDTWSVGSMSIDLAEWG